MTDIAFDLPSLEDASCVSNHVPLAAFAVAMRPYESDLYWPSIDRPIDAEHNLKHVNHDAYRSTHTFEISKVGKLQLRLFGEYSDEFNILTIIGRICCCGRPPNFTLSESFSL
jgi:hypothetical protein